MDPWSWNLHFSRVNCTLFFSKIPEGLLSMLWCKVASTLVTAAPPLPSSPTRRNLTQCQGGVWFSVSKKVQGNTILLHFSFDLLWYFLLFFPAKLLDRIVCMHWTEFSSSLYWTLFKLTSVSLSSHPVASLSVSSSSPTTLATLLFLEHSRCALPSTWNILLTGLTLSPFKVIAQILPFYWYLLTVTNSAFKSFPSFLKIWYTCACFSFIIYKIIISSFIQIILTYK